jgi:hypothetical protein
VITDPGIASVLNTNKHGSRQLNWLCGLYTWKCSCIDKIHILITLP